MSFSLRHSAQTREGTPGLGRNRAGLFDGSCRLFLGVENVELHVPSGPSLSGETCHPLSMEETACYQTHIIYILYNDGIIKLCYTYPIVGYSITPFSIQNMVTLPTDTISFSLSLSLTPASKGA